MSATSPGNVAIRRPGHAVLGPAAKEIENILAIIYFLSRLSDIIIRGISISCQWHHRCCNVTSDNIGITAVATLPATTSVATSMLGKRATKARERKRSRGKVGRHIKRIYCCTDSSVPEAWHNDVQVNEKFLGAGICQPSFCLLVCPGHCQ